MRIEIILFLIAAAVMANIYTDGKLLRNAFAYKKYYQMAGVGVGALALYLLFKKNPKNLHGLVATTHEYMKYMPVDRNTSSMLNPILDFTSKFSAGLGAGSGYGSGSGVLDMAAGSGRHAYAENRIQSSGDQRSGDQRSCSDPLPSSNIGGGGGQIKATKRSVSETKKKYVAAQQGWKCGNCQRQLPAWFEVDHKVRLEHGGSNHIDNLVALCRDCHGEKTAIENL